MIQRIEALKAEVDRLAEKVAADLLAIEPDEFKKPDHETISGQLDAALMGLYEASEHLEIAGRIALRQEHGSGRLTTRASRCTCRRR